MRSSASSIILDVAAIAATCTNLHEEGFTEACVGGDDASVCCCSPQWLRVLQVVLESGEDSSRIIVYALFCLSLAIASVPGQISAVAAALMPSQKQDRQVSDVARCDFISGAIGCLGWFALGMQSLATCLPAQLGGTCAGGVLAGLMQSLSKMTQEVHTMQSGSCTLVPNPAATLCRTLKMLTAAFKVHAALEAAGRMLNVLGVYGGSVICSDAIYREGASASDTARHIISAVELNNSVFLQCVASVAPPVLPLQTCRALASRLKRRTSIKLLPAAVECQCVAASLHSLLLASSSSDTLSALGLWSIVKCSWAAYSNGD
jgi:hypothetical protein